MGVGTLDFSSTDPKKIAQQNRQWGLSTGQGLMDQAGADATGAAQKSGDTNSQIQGLLDPSGTMSKLDQWMNPLASGQGGYNADELSQIRMSPEQQQDMVTSAGISAGLRNSAAVGAAQRASAASGGNPLALATYRARAAQQGAAEAGDAMTNARVGASNAAAGRAQTIGNTRLGQQNTGLGYYSGVQNQGTNYLSGLQQQQTGQQESALNRQLQSYGTATGAANSAGSLAESASQNPSIFDKVMGGVAGAVGGAGGLLSKLEDGAVMPGNRPAVVGENGPEKIVSLRRDYMDDGGIAAAPSLYRALPAPPAAPVAPTAPDLGTTTPNADGSLTFAPGKDSISLGTPTQTGFRGFLDRMKTGLQSQPQPAAATPQQPVVPSPVNTARTLGQIGGTLASKFLADGHVQGKNGVFTQPTRVNLDPGEAVVPLSYRAKAKVRPSMASLPAARVR